MLIMFAGNQRGSKRSPDYDPTSRAGLSTGPLTPEKMEIPLLCDASFAGLDGGPGCYALGPGHPNIEEF